ncbi:MAG TPA: plastocyanin/azurin family copper-binding protein [Nitrosopumilaceae archaeon]|nr:plastocyanin/azurin family copper-binding protein [Nitrosopumilaceae archaeon]
MRQNYKISFSLFTIFTIVIFFGFIQAVDAADDRTKLEAEMINPSTGKDDGKAKFEQRDDRKTFSVEIEDQKSDSTFKIKLNGTILGTFITDDSGFADFNLDSRDGDTIPHVTSGSRVEVVDSNQNVVLSGKMIGTDGTQDVSSPVPPPVSEPVSTTKVIIPFGAKDKNVSEFYVPSAISVSLSETITWTNQDDTEHTVTSRSSGVFNSGLFGTSQSFSHQFTVDGTYEYFCQLHPWMTGTVIAGKGGDVSAPPEPTPQSPSNPAPVPTPTPTPTPTPSNPQSPSQFTVTIPSGAAEQTITEFYLPNSISIRVFDSILWKNSDIGFHTVTSGQGSSNGLFDSGLYGPGETFSHQFTSVGTFDYFCLVHPWMSGKVLVNPASSLIASPSQPTTTPIEPSLPPIPQDSLPDPQPIPEPNPASKILEVIIPQGAALQTVEEYYLPSKISINTSDSITWKNQDEGFHTVTSAEGGLFDSGLFGPTKSFSFQFNKAGNFDYFCAVHPWMTGSVVVTGQEKTNQSETTKTILSPLKQMNKGIMAKNVQCKTGYDLIVKTAKELGACVKPTSLPVLIQRGWGQ